MTKKDYELIARVLRTEGKYALTAPALSGPQRGAAVAAIEATADAFADALAAKNPGFDRARFLRACGVEV